MVQFMDNNSGFRQFQQMRNAEGAAAPKKGFSLTTWLLIAVVAYMMFGQKKEPPAPPPAPESEIADISKVPIRTVGGGNIDLAVQGIRLHDVVLKNYKENIGGDAPVKLLADGAFAEVGLLASGTAAPTASSVWRDGVWKSPEGVEFRRQVSVGDDYVISVADRIKNGGKKPVSFAQYVRIVKNGGEASKFAVHSGAVASIGGKMKEKSWRDVAAEAPIWQARQAFAGWTDQYWQVVAAAGQPSAKTVKIRQRADKMFLAEIIPEYLTVDPGATVSVSAEIFAGPKTQEILNAASVKIPGIDRTIDYGWFGFLSRPFLWILMRLGDLIPNYGAAIILLTLAIRGLMWPLTKKSIRGAAAMQKLQPELARIQSAYAGDKARMQQEIMRLYQAHKTNPMSSLGVMFLQIPIFFALYKALLIAVPLRHAGFLWISDLSVMDPYFILPILMTGAMWLQNRMTQAKAEAPGMRMMKWMPLIFGFMFAFMPAGLVLYWTVSSLAGIIQTKIITKSNGGKNGGEKS